MARCGCGGSCPCSVQGDGSTTTVAGSGSADSPFVVSAAGAGALADGDIYSRYTDVGTMATLTPDFIVNIADDILDFEDAAPGFTWDTSGGPTNEGLNVGKQAFYEIYYNMRFDSDALTTGQAELWFHVAGAPSSFRGSTIPYGSGVDLELTLSKTVLVPAAGITVFKVRSTEAVDVVYAEIEVKRLTTYP